MPNQATPYTYSQLKNQHAKGEADIIREKGTLIDLYRHDVQTLFRVYQDFLQLPELKEAKIEGYFKFFRETMTIKERGAPAEAILCSAIHLLAEQKDEAEAKRKIEAVIRDWGFNFHFALQFAVIEYLNNENRLGSVNWNVVIKFLFSLGADPYYPSTTFKRFLTPSNWTEPLDNLNNTLLLVLFQTRESEKILPLADELVRQGKEIKSQFNLKKEDCGKIISLLPCDEKQALSAHPKFIWLEHNFPDAMREYLQENAKKLLLKLINKNDLFSIEHLRVKYEIDPFDLLIETELAAGKRPSHVWKYLKKQFPERLKEVIKKNHAAFIDKFKIVPNTFANIDTYISKYGIDPFERLVNKAKMDLILLTYLEDTFPEKLAKDLEDRNKLKEYIKKILQQDEYEILLAKLYQHVPSGVTLVSTVFECCHTEHATDNKMDPSYNLTADRAFKALVNLDYAAVKQVLTQPVNEWFITQVANNIDARMYLTYRHQIDLNLQDDHARNPRFRNFYMQRARWILEYIVQQAYPKANELHAKRSWYATDVTTEFSHNGRRICVSNELYAIVEELKKISLGQSHNFGKLYAVVPAQGTAQQDAVELEIFTALRSHLKDNSPLSVKIRTKYQGLCELGPLLNGLDEKHRTPNTPFNKFVSTLFENKPAEKQPLYKIGEFLGAGVKPSKFLKVKR